MSKTITNLSTLKINYLTSQQYQDALEGGEINPDELYLTPASGRGSSVTYNEILFSGTAIGQIDIDGAQYTIYAPTPPTKTSDLTNDSNFVVDSSYVHTDNNYTTTEKNKLSGIASGAEVNQNAFATVKVGTTNLIADEKNDTLTITAGDNITLTPTANSDSFTIAATDTKYTAATTAPGKVASASSTGTSTNYARQDHTHGIDLATGDSNGQVKIAGSNVSVKGLGSAAYTNSTAYLGSSLKGAASGVAQLDSNGLVPSSQLPSYVDDVLEYDKLINFPVTGQTGKIYVDTTTNKTYRWSGTTYVEISASLALGTTSQTAYRGDYGNTAYTHATDSNKLTTATSSGLYKVAATAQGHIASLTAVTKADITALGIPGQDTNTTYSASTVSIGSASTGTAIPADDITAWTTNTPTAVTPATVVTGGTTASITPVTKKTVVVGGTTASITPVTKKTVVTGGTTSSITPVTKKTVVTSASGATATVSNGVLTLTNGSFGTGDSVTTGTAVNVYTGLTTGDSVTTGTAQTVVTELTTGDSVTNGTAVTVYKSLTTGPAATVTAGTAASLSYTAKSIPNISVSSQTVVTGITAN